MYCPGLRAPRRVAAGVVILLCSASLCGAQSILDARRVEFLPSPDNSAVDGNGVALVDRYAMDIFPAGAATPYETVDLGKPVPEADGYIRVDFVALLPLPLTLGATYEATVSAVGPGGSAASGRTNTFGLSAPCSYSISPNGQSFGAGGGAGSFAVTTDTTCQWTAVSQAAWLTVTGGASGTGPGTVSFSAASNTDPASRSGTLLAAGWNFTVLESAATCTYSASPSSIAVPAPAASLSIAVSAPDGCAWTASSPAPWADVASGAAGSGAGTVTIAVSRNNSVSSRSTTLVVAGQSIVLTQQGKPRRK